MSNLAPELLYFLFALYLLAIMVVLVPRRNIHRLFPAAIITGSIVAFGFIFLFGNLFGLFKYLNYGAYHVFGVPFWIILAWHPSIVFSCIFSQSGNAQCNIGGILLDLAFLV